MERPPTATEEKLLTGIAGLNKTLEQQGALLEEMRVEMGAVKASVHSIEACKESEACKEYCEELADQLEAKFKARDARDAHIVTALEQMDEYVQGILAQVSLQPQTTGKMVVDSQLKVASGGDVREDESPDSPWQKTLLQLVGKAMEANLLQDRLQRELSDGARRPVPLKHLALPEDGGRAERCEVENLKLKDRVLKLELELAGAYVDKNLADHLDQQDPSPPPRRSTGSKGRKKSPIYGEAIGKDALQMVPEVEDSQPRAPREMTGVSVASALSARSISARSTGARSHFSSTSSSISGTTCRYLDEAPQRAFVINVRRLISTQKLLSLLHILVNSTAIAALTLVQAGTSFQLYSTICFLTCVVAIFAVHDTSWDRIDISDMCSLLPLLSDDCEDGTEHVHNPNRMLKAMSFTEARIWWWAWWSLHFVGLSCCTLSWIILVRYWTFAAGTSDDSESHGIVDQWALKIAMKPDTDDGAIIGMQIMVGTVMFVLHLFFEYVYQREMGAVMPATAKEHVWDPRKDGVPFKYQWFGLPSMWFTSDTTLRDLYRWIDSAHPTKSISMIYPQELALYALSGDQHRHFLKEALKEAKLFNGNSRKFVKKDGSAPQSLAIELCFFDQQQVKTNYNHPGEFLELGAAGMKARRSQVADMVSALQELSDKVVLTRSKSTEVPPNPCCAPMQGGLHLV